MESILSQSVACKPQTEGLRARPNTKPSVRAEPDTTSDLEGHHPNSVVGVCTREEASPDWISVRLIQDGGEENGQEDTNEAEPQSEQTQSEGENEL